MIHVRADQVKNIKNAVADNFSGCRYPESHLLQCDLYRTEKMGLYFFQILAGGRNCGDRRKRFDPFVWNAVCGRSADRYCCMPLEKRPEEDTRSGTRWIIVLGAQVRGRKITDSLKRRLDSALEYLKEHPDVHVIVSGGQGNDEEVTEAYAMAQYLERAGIDCRRIIQEDASVNTLENLSCIPGICVCKTRRI